jgi:hypothetical protein
VKLFRSLKSSANIHRFWLIFIIYYPLHDMTALTTTSTNRCSIMRHRSEKSSATALFMRLVCLTIVVGPLVFVSGRGTSHSEYLQRPTSRPLLLPYSNAFHSILCIRGGQISPYQQKVPPRIQGWSGQQFTDGGSRRPTTHTTTVGRMEEEGKTVESDASTREAIDAFLTRDSRNSFIGE